ncbi:enoyl-CoA hydratase-related protein [Nocardioides bruguierae]|uniref:Enoyl-CoA hydratase-related protein n=1 Tax=Nocardioides bruguierae TaxID=2945102 RepID=A0A9X2IEP5_9ACTN|nr:enoyl-CoA hydratase-related protein [Nocardioides bruguierae]MCM0620273.1 enoyl-CoA hydratase-related protein [Nocardioides bruguierae]
MDAPLVRTDVDGAVVTLTLDSPANRNALSRRLLAELDAALVAAAERPGTRVVVLAATGRVFCAGADLSEAAGGSMEETTAAIVGLQRRMLTLPVPVLARVQGPVRAGGLGLVAAADVVVASTQATFALTEVRLGLAPLAVSLTVLPRLTDRAAAWAALGGEVFDAATATSWGLVTTVVDADDLDAEVGWRADVLAQGDPQGQRETKALLVADLVARIDAEGANVARRSATLFGSDAAQAAMAAFLERGRGRNS